MILAREAKTGHIYRVTEDYCLFIVGTPDKYGTHIWYYDSKGEFFYEKHLFDNVEIIEVKSEKYCRLAIKEAFKSEFFAENF